MGCSQIKMGRTIGGVPALLVASRMHTRVQLKSKRWALCPQACLNEGKEGRELAQGGQNLTTEAI